MTMDFNKRILPVIFLLCIWLCGCRNEVPAPEASVVYVTQVNIDYQYRQSHLRRSYTNTDKMDVFLYYLYDLSPHGQPEEDPEQIQGDSCKITVTLSNGEHRIYRQIGSQYLSVDSRPWQKISETKGALLYHLVNHIESDL